MATVETFGETHEAPNVEVSYQIRNGIMVSAQGHGLESNDNKLMITQHPDSTANSLMVTADKSHGKQVSNPPQSDVLGRTSTRAMITTLPTRYDVTEFVGVLKTNGPSVKPVSDPSNFEHFKNYVKGKPCYEASILDQAKQLEENRLVVGFEVDLWTLMETRSFKRYQRPYKSQDSTPTHPENDPFDWKLPDSESIRTDSYNPKPNEYNLKETQSQIDCVKCLTEGKLICPTCIGQKGRIIGNITYPCAKCSATGYLTCKECQGSGFLLSWTALVVKRKVLHSTGYFQNTFLPKDTIRKMPNKMTLFDEEKRWNNNIFITEFTHLCDFISHRCPVNFLKDLQQQFQDKHVIEIQELTSIVQLRCSIRAIPAMEIDYELPDFVNESNRNKGTHRFTYILYGTDDHGKALVYENDYPLNCCSCTPLGKGCHANCAIS